MKAADKVRLFSCKSEKQPGGGGGGCEGLSLQYTEAATAMEGDLNNQTDEGQVSNIKASTTMKRLYKFRF